MRVLRNLERALFNEGLSKAEVVRFWQSTAYYNFIQRVLDSQLHRPSAGDYPNGWNNFFHLVKVIKPDYCLFAGLGASSWVYCFMEAAKAHDFQVEGIEQLPIFGSCSPRLSSIRAQDGQATKLVFIKHPSRYFPAQAWGTVLEEHLPKYLRWIRTALKDR